MSSLSSKIYFSFSTLVLLMIISTSISMLGNSSLISQLEVITKKSTPFMMELSRLNIKLLDVNRSLTPYFSSKYSDELPDLRNKIEKKIIEYNDQFDLIEQLSGSNPDYRKSLLESKDIYTNLINEINYLLDDFNKYIELMNDDIYEQSQLRTFISELVNNLGSKSVGIDDKEKQETIDALLTQVNLLSTEVNYIFSLQDSLEFSSVEHKIKNRKKFLFESLGMLKLHVKDVYHYNGKLFSILENSVFGHDGVVSKHMILIKKHENIISKRLSIENILDSQIKIISSLSKKANDDSKMIFYNSFSYSHKMMVIMASISVFSILAAILTGISIANILRKANKEVQDALSKVSEKDLSARVHYTNKDEFGSIAKKINFVIDHLSTMIKGIRYSASELSMASVENQSTSQLLNESIVEQACQTSLISESMGRIESSVVDITELANQTLSTVTDVVNCSSLGQDTMQQNLLFLDELSQNVGQFMETISHLESESSSIESILYSISRVSEQTNLLALNAAIEAARAGDKGRGFSVVADEVRILASQSSESAKHIQQKIERLQSISQRAASLISQSASSMENSKQKTEEVSHVLGSIHNFLRIVEANSHQVASKATEHQNLTSTMVENINQIQRLSKKNSQFSNQLAESAEKLENMAEEQSSLTLSFTLE